MRRQRSVRSVIGLFLLLAATPALGIDHDNLDSSRPLRIEDAESISFRERAIEYGIAGTRPFRSRRGLGLGLGLSAEYLYGFALNTHVSLDFDPYIGSRSQSRDTGFDQNNIGVGVLRNLNRESLTKPAFAVRGDVYLPTGRGASGVGVRLRGILSRTFKQYSRFHVNADLNLQTNASGGRSIAPAVTVGISRPLGYPTQFNRTGLIELGVRASEESGKGAILYTGVGIRQQVTPRSALDLGITSDFAATNSGASRNSLRLVAGYSTQF